MPKSAKPRKKYRPSGLSRQDRIASTTLPLRLASGHKLRADQVRDMLLAAGTALKSVEMGKATENDLHQLAFTSNVSLLMAESGMGPEFIPEVKEAQEHIVGLITRHNRGESIVLSGPGIQSVRRLLELHDAQVGHEDFTEGLAYQAVRAVLQRMYQGHVMVPDA